MASQVPAEDLPQNLVSAEDLPDAVRGMGSASPSLMEQLGSEIARPFVTTGKEFAGGLQQAFAPEYSSATPGAFEKYVSTPVSQVMGLLRAIGAPVTGFVAEPAERGIGNLLRTLGAPEPVAQVAGTTAGLGASLFAPEAIASMLPNILQRTGRVLAHPAAVPIREAEAAQASNIAANAADRAAYEQAIQLHERQRQAFQAYQLQQEQARQLSQAAVAERMTRISDKEQALMEATRRAALPTTNEQAYAFMNQGMPMPPVAVPKLTKALEGVQADLEITPRVFQPTGVVKAERGATSAIDKTTGGRIIGPQGQDLSNLSPLQQSIWAPVLEQMGQAVSGGSIKLDTLQKVQQGIGQLTRSTDPRVSGVAKHLYKNMMEDLEEASKTIPEAGQFLAATKIARQNTAAEDLADFMTSHGTRVKNGQILIQPDKLAQELRKDDPLGLSRSLRPEALADIQAALEDVFKVKTAPKLRPEDILTAPAPKVGPAPKPRARLSEAFEPTRSEGLLSRHPFISGAVVGSYLGIPHAIGIAATLMYPRAIFRAAITPTGRKFIRALYAQTPPLANDMARYGAVVNFLRSQGERDVEPAPELVQWQQQQAQAQAQAQQQQQQMQLQQLLMQQQQGGQR